MFTVVAVVAGAFNIAFAAIVPINVSFTASVAFAVAVTAAVTAAVTVSVPVACRCIYRYAPLPLPLSLPSRSCAVTFSVTVARRLLLSFPLRAITSTVAVPVAAA